MTLLLLRVDERLIHGQVVMGLRGALRFDRILVADDALAGDAWEREVLLSGAPPDIAAQALDVASAARRLTEGLPGRAILLVRSPAVVLDLVRGGAPIREVNLGGLHARRRARRFLDYLYFTPEDIAALREMDARGIRLTGQDLPGHPAVSLNAALAEGRLEYDQLPAGDP